MLAIALALLTMIGWATSDIFGTVTSRRVGAFKATFLVFLITLPPYALIIPAHLHELSGATLPIILLTILLGFIVITGYLAFAEAVRIGNPSIVGTISGSFVGLVVILSIIFLGDTLNQLQVLGILVILTGMILTSLNFRDLSKGKVKFNRSIALSFVALVGWGVYFTFIKVPVNHIGWFWPEMISTAAGAGIILLIGFRQLAKDPPPIKRWFWPVLGCGLFGGGASLVYNMALQHGATAVIAPIAGSYPVLYVLLSALIFHEGVTRTQRLGMTITLIGIVALSVVSG